MHHQSLNLIKQLITHNNLILLILEVVHNYILFNYVYPVFDRISVIWLSTREHTYIHEEACARMHERVSFWDTTEPWRNEIYIVLAGAYYCTIDFLSINSISPEMSELTISSGAKTLPPTLWPVTMVQRRWLLLRFTMRAQYKRLPRKLMYRLLFYGRNAPKKRKPSSWLPLLPAHSHQSLTKRL